MIKNKFVIVLLTFSLLFYMGFFNGCARNKYDQIVHDFKKGMDSYVETDVYDNLTKGTRYKLKVKPINFTLLDISKSVIDHGYSMFAILKEASDLQGGEVISSGTLVIKGFKEMQAQNDIPILDAKQTYKILKTRTGAAALDEEALEEFKAKLRDNTLDEMTFVHAMAILSDQTKYEDRSWESYFELYTAGLESLRQNGLPQGNFEAYFRTIALISSCLEREDILESATKKFSPYYQIPDASFLDRQLGNTTAREALCRQEGLHPSGKN